ncbi:MAG: right-handed parallel beta-helix repeat-containing protein [Acidobacteriaceae bacterium]|nr:right-handed parallel beta-helix repeat-containing protein [Acidobacteriaceae bacterium]
MHCPQFPWDGISVQYVEDPVIENCEAYRNAQLGIHLGTGAMRAIVRYTRAHDHRGDGFYLCYRVQQSRYEQNQSDHNGGFGISLGHKDSDNLFLRNLVKENARAGIYFRKEPRASAANRSVFRENQILIMADPTIMAAASVSMARRQSSRSSLMSSAIPARPRRNAQAYASELASAASRVSAT